MSNIILHQFGSVLVGLNKKTGFINITALAKAYGLKTGKKKQPADWLKTERAKEYVNYLTTITNIHLNDLVITSQGNHDDAGTWVHPDLAVPFATWLSVEFEYQVSQMVLGWRENKSHDRYPEQITGEVPQNPHRDSFEKVKTAFEVIFSGVAEELRTGMVIEGVCAIHPDLRPALEPHKPQLLIASKLLTPTEIGNILQEKTGEKYTPNRVNKLLIDRGFQRSTGKSNPTYEPIGQGCEFGQLVADTAKGHGKTVQHLRWYPSIADRLV